MRSWKTVKRKHSNVKESKGKWSPAQKSQNTIKTSGDKHREKKQKTAVFVYDQRVQIESEINF